MIVEYRESTRRNIVFFHELLRPDLASLEESAFAVEPEYTQILPAEKIDDPRHKRSLGPNYGEIYFLLLRKLEKRLLVRSVYGNAFTETGDSRVSRCCIYLIDVWGFRKLPGYRVFPASSAYHKNLHPCILLISYRCITAHRIRRGEERRKKEVIINLPGRHA